MPEQKKSTTKLVVLLEGPTLVFDKGGYEALMLVYTYLGLHRITCPYLPASERGGVSLELLQHTPKVLVHQSFSSCSYILYLM